MDIVSVEIRYENDVVAARQRARSLAAMLRFDGQDQARIATAVSEIARNAYQYGKGGRAVFSVEYSPTPIFLIRITDRGPGIPNLTDVLGGSYVSATGMGMGILGSKRLMDQFEIQTSSDAGTAVIMGKELPRGIVLPDSRMIAEITAELAVRPPGSAFEEMRRQNHELARALDELQAKQSELGRLNQELEDTNRGVLALYAELDEKAESLKRASETKTSFLSNMTHEFRTPVNSILNLSRLLLDRVDGELTEEQDRQVRFIQKAAHDLSDLVNDLLDLAKVEAGKIAVRVEKFDACEVMGALRGILRPLTINPAVQLVFVEPEGVSGRFETDEGKLSQILRNLISNALKYTEQGEVRVTAREEEGGWAVFDVIDTGIGIHPEDQERIFEDFTQIDSPLQKKFKGTGLGLPLSRKLAQLLGGSLTVQSEPGKGSTFSLRIPMRYNGEKEVSLARVGVGGGTSRLTLIEPDRPRILLLIDDDPAARYILIECLKSVSDWGSLKVLEAGRGEKGLELARKERPEIIFLDLHLPGMDGYEVLSELKADTTTQHIPVIIHTSQTVREADLHGLAEPVSILPKEDIASPAALSQLRSAFSRAGVELPVPKEGGVA